MARNLAKAAHTLSSAGLSEAAEALAGAGTSEARHRTAAASHAGHGATAGAAGHHAAESSGSACTEGAEGSRPATAIFLRDLFAAKHADFGIRRVGAATGWAECGELQRFGLLRGGLGRPGCRC
ncbi:MAG: hypothetical protein R3B97_01485 [Dehalococcoidia bacterium]